MLKIKFERESVELEGNVEDYRQLLKIVENAADPRQTGIQNVRVQVSGSKKYVTLNFKPGQTAAAL